MTIMSRAGQRTGPAAAKAVGARQHRLADAKAAIAEAASAGVTARLPALARSCSQKMADAELLAAFLDGNALSHLTPFLVKEWTLPTLEAKLEEGRSGFLTYLKSAGVAALKDRQSLTNAVGKNRREREAAMHAKANPPPIPDPEASTVYKMFIGPNGDCDFFGRRRGAHKDGFGVCMQFVRIDCKNENDLMAFNCFRCHRPASEHIDLGEAPVVDDTDDLVGENFDIARFAVDGRTGMSALAQGQRQPQQPAVGGVDRLAALPTAPPTLRPELPSELTHDMSQEHLCMFAAGTDPLGAVLATSQWRAPAEPEDPLARAMGAASFGRGTALEISDPLGLGQMGAPIVPPQPREAPPRSPPPRTPPPPVRASAVTTPASTSASTSATRGCSPLALSLGLPEAVSLRLGDVEPSTLRPLLASPAGKAQVDATLKQAGLTSMGHRLKLIAGLLAADHHPPSGDALPRPDVPRAVVAPRSVDVAPGASGPSDVSAPSDEPEALAAARANGTDVGTLRRLAAAGDRVRVAELLRADGYKTGHRLKIEAALYGLLPAPTATPATPLPAVATLKPFQVDMFGIKRGRGLRDLSCRRYRALVVQMNHCAGPGNPAQLDCLGCGFAPGAHEDLGMWTDGEPMVISVSGQRFRTLSERTVNVE